MTGKKLLGQNQLLCQKAGENPDRFANCGFSARQVKELKIAPRG